MHLKQGMHFACMHTLSPNASPNLAINGDAAHTGTRAARRQLMPQLELRLAQPAHSQALHCARAACHRQAAPQLHLREREPTDKRGRSA